jgi:hypothetical protein
MTLPVGAISRENRVGNPCGVPIQVGNLEGRRVMQGALAFLQNNYVAAIVVFATNWLTEGVSIYCSQHLHDYLRKNCTEEDTADNICMATFVAETIIGSVVQGIVYGRLTNLSKPALIAISVGACVARFVNFACAPKRDLGPHMRTIFYS